MKSKYALPLHLAGFISAAKTFKGDASEPEGKVEGEEAPVVSL